MNLVFIHLSRFQDTPYAKLMLWSVKKYMPDAKLYQITDSDGPKLKGVNGVIRSEYRYYNQRDWNQTFLKELQKLDLPEYIWIDPDMAFTGDISSLMKGNFEIGICKRHDDDGTDVNYQKMNPYNVGVVIVKNPKFIKDCSNELTHSNYTKKHIVQHTIGTLIDSGEYRVKFFDGLIYNRAPKKPNEYDDKTLVWHFKGETRKQWMKSWMEVYLNGGRHI